MTPLERYLEEVCATRSTGASVPETSAAWSLRVPMIRALFEQIASPAKCVGVISREGGGTLDPEANDLAVTAGWGHAGQNGVTMPGRGKAVERAHTPAEQAAIEGCEQLLGLKTGEALRLLGGTTFDVYLNGVAYWRNVPSRVWGYTLGGYQVIKKWLSYREKGLLGRDLTLDEAREVMNIARRIAAIRLMEPALDESYAETQRATGPSGGQDSQATAG